MEQSSSWEDTSSQLVKKLPTFYEIQGFIIILTQAHHQARLFRSASSHLNYLRTVYSHIHKSVVNMTVVSACLCIHSPACLHAWKILTCTRLIFFNLVLVIFAKICWHMPVLVETVQQQQTLYMKTYVHLYCFGYWGHLKFLWLPWSLSVPVFLWLLRMPGQ